MCYFSAQFNIWCILSLGFSFIRGEGDCNCTKNSVPNIDPYKNVGDCLDAILTAETNNQQYILIGDEINNYKLNATVYKLPWPRTIATPSTIRKVVNKFSGIILLFPDSNATQYDLFLESISNQHEIKYVAYTETVVTVFHLFEQFWKSKILDIVVLYRSSSGFITVFTYHPFTKKGCNTDTPVRINKWNDRKGKFYTDEYLFSKKRKVYDLHGCPVRASLKAPSLAESILNKNSSVASISLEIFNFFEKHMNFTGLLVDGDRPNSDDYTLDYMNLSNTFILSLIRGEVDVAVGKFSMLSHHGLHVEGPIQNTMDCYTWAVPTKIGRNPSMWTTYVYEFDWYTWMVLAGLQCMSTGFFFWINQLKIHRRDPFSRSFNVLSALSFVLGIAVKSKPKNDSLRIFYVATVLFCFVTNAAYQATMGSLVTVPPDSYDISNTHELLESDIILTGNPRMFYMLLASNKSSHTVHQVLDRFHTINPGAFMQTLEKIYTTRKFAVFERSETLEKLGNIIKNTLNISNPYYVVPECLSTAYNSPFLLKTGSILWDPFTRIGSILVESGIVKKWESIRERMDELSNQNTTLIESKVRKYSVKQMRGGLIILFCGYFLSILAFLGEIITKGFKFKNSTAGLTANAKAKEKFIK